MALSSNLISQFVKATKDKPETKQETSVQGTIVYNGKHYVKFDGSDLLTPVSTTADVKDGDRVTVIIKDHTATVNGNISSPSARTEDLQSATADVITEEQKQAIAKIFQDLIDKINSFENLDIDKLTAAMAVIDKLKVKYAEIDHVDAKTIEAINAEIENLEAIFIETEHLEAFTAEITNLKGYNAEFTYVSAGVLNALKAVINDLDVKKLNVENAIVKDAEIAFLDVDQAWFDKFYAASGIIQDVTIEEGTVVKELVGVTITGDLIKANTLKVDQLVVRGSDGHYYALSTDFTAMEGVEPVEEDSIHGSAIVANSITAEKIKASDLTAFGATIASFHINRSEETGVGRIYSGVKESVENSAPGMYMDNDGQVAFGDADNYIRFQKTVDENGEYVVDKNGKPIYKLEIAADSVKFGVDSKSSVEDLKPISEHIKIEEYVDEVTGVKQACIELSGRDADGDGVSDFKQVITSNKTMFMDGIDPKTQIDTDGIQTDKLVVTTELEQKGPSGSFTWAIRPNGNYGLSWKGVTS